MEILVLTFCFLHGGALLCVEEERGLMWPDTCETVATDDGWKLAYEALMRHRGSPLHSIKAECILAGEPT